MIAARFLSVLLLSANLGASGVASTCPATRPMQPMFAVPASFSTQPEPQAFFFGTSELWTQLRADGRIARRDKIFWWRPGYNGASEPHPNLAITISPFGSGISMASSAPATNAFFGGAWSMLTMLEFPAAGCWEVTGAYAGHKLTFVTAVQ